MILLFTQLSNGVVSYKFIWVVIFHPTSSPKNVLQMERERGNKNMSYPYPMRAHGKGFYSCSARNGRVSFDRPFRDKPFNFALRIVFGSIKIHLSYCPVNHLALADYVLVMSFCPRVPHYTSPLHSSFGYSRTAEQPLRPKILSWLKNFKPFERFFFCSFNQVFRARDRGDNAQVKEQAFFLFSCTKLYTSRERTVILASYLLQGH